MGLGNYWRISHEFLLLGVRGNCLFRQQDEKSWVELLQTQNGAKPDRARSLSESAQKNPFEFAVLQTDAVSGRATVDQQVVSSAELVFGHDFTTNGTEPD